MAVFNIRTAQVDVGTAGTAEQLASAHQVKVRFVMIQALPGNAGNVYVGNDASADVAAATGIVMEPGDKITIDMTMAPFQGDELIDLTNFWFDAAVSADDIAVMYLT